jgi:3-dehydroquinate synthase II
VDAVIVEREREHVARCRPLSKIPVLAAEDLEVRVPCPPRPTRRKPCALAQGKAGHPEGKAGKSSPWKTSWPSPRAWPWKPPAWTGRLAAGILERGVDRGRPAPGGRRDLKTIVRELKLSQGTMELETATVTAVTSAGLGHRVCVDTMSS